MRSVNIIEGLQTLLPFYDGKAYTVGAEHDILYAYATARPLPPEVVEKMFVLGWFQETEGSDAWVPGQYDPEQSWSAYV